MAASNRPPFPRGGWSDPEAEQGQVAQTRERLDRAEGALAGAASPAPVSPVLEESAPSMVTAYGGPPPMAPAYGGPMRAQLARAEGRSLSRPIGAAVVGLLLGLGLCLKLHLATGALVLGAVLVGGLGWLVGLAIRHLEDRR